MMCTIGRRQNLEVYIQHILLDSFYKSFGTKTSELRLRSQSPMAYVERGVVKSKRSIWRLKTITDFFWAIVNLIGVFFATMFSMEKSDAYRKGSGASKKWDGGGPGGPGGGPYGGGPRGPPRGLDNVRGIDHSSLPACGSCCG
ncbi:selenoprotein K [Rosa chinensis]|nr:selenoprotein K [Rosa chinensis]